MSLPSREEIKTWLKVSTEGREWLAGELGVAKTTIDQWLSKKEIPIAQHHKIAGLMKVESGEEEEATSLIRVPFDDELLEKAHKAASIVSAEFQDFCSRAIRHRAEEVLKLNRPRLSTVAEDSPEYGEDEKGKKS